MSKPIEPGCIAMIKGIVNRPEFNGLIVTVVMLYDGRYGPVECLAQAPGVKWWLIDSAVIQKIAQRQLGVASELCLRRIDDGDLDLQREETDELTKVF